MGHDLHAAKSEQLTQPGSAKLHYAHMHKCCTTHTCTSVMPPKPQDHRSTTVTSQAYGDKSDFFTFQCAPVHSMQNVHICCSSSRKSINFSLRSMIRLGSFPSMEMGDTFLTFRWYGHTWGSLGDKQSLQVSCGQAATLSGPNVRGEGWVEG